MDENANNSCICDTGYSNGIFKKTIENNIFTIFGNISQNNNIILRYHGELIDNICYEQYENNLYIKYFFDDDQNNIIKTNLAKCTKCIGENYCTLLNLAHHSKITFSFCLKENLEKENLMSFNLNIQEDLLTSFMNKYNIEENVINSSNLPALETKQTTKFKNILQGIKDYLILIKKKLTSV